MTSIALIADIHGNLPALSAVESDLQARGIDTVYCLGDMCGRGPNGGAVIDWCRTHCNVIIMGNWDEHIALGRRQDYLREVGEERQKFLQTLPFYHCFWLSGRRVHLFHGRPLMPAILWEDSPLEAKLSAFTLIPDDFPPDIVGCADIHRQYKTDFKDDPRVLFNTGSVGNSFCSPTACYVILRGTLNSRDPAPLSWEFVSLPYDNRQAVQNMRQAAWFDSPEEYEREITDRKSTRLNSSH